MDQGARQERHSQWPAWALALLVAVLAVGLWDLRSDARLDTLAPADPYAPDLGERVQAQFGLNQPIVIVYAGLLPGDGLRAEVLEEVQAVSAWLQTLPGVTPDRVMSLSTRSWVSHAGAAPVLQPLLPPSPLAPGAAAAVQRGLIAAPAYRGVLVCEDARRTRIFAEIQRSADAGKVLRTIEQQLRSRPLPPGISVSIGGQGAVSGELSRQIDRDVRWLLPGAVLLTLLFMAVLLRSAVALLVGATVLGGAMLGTLGLMGWMGQPLSPLTVALLVVIACFSIAGSVQMLTRAAALQTLGLDAPAAVYAARADLLRPLSLSSLAVAGGYSVLAWSSPTAALKALGYFAAIGIGLAWLFNVYGLPRLYAGIARCWPSAVAARDNGSEELLREFGQFSGRWPHALLVLAAGLLALAAWGASLQPAATPRFGNLEAQAALLHKAAWGQRPLHGAHHLDIRLQTASGSLIDPARLAAVADLQAWMRRSGGFVGSLSHVDLLLEFRGAAASLPVAPITLDEAQRWLRLRADADPAGVLAAHLGADHREALVRGFLRTDDLLQVPAQAAFLQQQLDRRLAVIGVRGQVVGHTRAASARPGYDAAALGVGAVLALVALSVVLAYRSVSMAVVGVLATSAALLGGSAAMGASQLRLDLLGPFFAVLCAGLGADCVLHLLHAIDHVRRRGAVGAALGEAALARVGVALTFNALALAGGLLVLGLSTLTLVAHFGLLAAAALWCAALAAGVILPSWYALRSAGTPPACTGDKPQQAGT